MGLTSFISSLLLNCENWVTLYRSSYKFYILFLDNYISSNYQYNVHVHVFSEAEKNLIVHGHLEIKLPHIFSHSFATF